MIDVYRINADVMAEMVKMDAEQRAEIERLRTVVEHLTASRDSWYSVNQTNEAYIGELRSEIDALRAHHATPQAEP